jgi:uncharacterized protein YecE (DUF72 family)
VTVFVGTCSWTGREDLLNLRFYGSARPSHEFMLRHYSSVYSTVEVDGMFYAIPPVQNTQRWVERTPDDFIFNVKAYGLFTRHGAQTNTLPKSIREALPPRLLGKNRVYLQDLRPAQVNELWDRYREALAPLQESGKLGLVLFQFPPGFGATTENATYIQSCKAELEGFGLAVEFRNRSWFEAPVKERTPEFLRENGLALVCVDMPQGLAVSIPSMAVTTAKDAYIRLHGRNGDNWERQDASVSNLHDYWYAEDELEEWIPRIRQLEQESKRVFVLLNTVQSLENAQILKAMLAESAIDQHL